MLEFLPSLGSLLCYGSVSAFSKKAISAIGRHKAIAYAYAALVALLLAGALILQIGLRFPVELFPAYLIQIALGGIGAIAAYKALDYGKSSITSPVAKVYVLLVLAMSIVFLGEELSAAQIGGSLLIVVSTFIIAFESKGSLRLERWMLYLGISILCRAYYYTFIKNFVVELGAYEATLVLELGVASFVVAFHALRGRDLSPPKLRDINFPLAAGALIFFGSLLYSLSVSIIGAALTAAISAGAPMVNAAVSYLLLGERLDMHKYAAIVLLVLGLIAILLL